MFIIACYGFPLAWTVHAASLVIFWHLGFDVLVLWESAATTLWLVLWLVILMRRDVLRMALFLATIIEIPLRAVLVTYYTGFATGFWTFLFIPLLILPLSNFWSKRTELWLGALLCLALIGTVILPSFTDPRVTVDPEWQIFFLTTNLVSVAFIIFVLMFLTNRVVTNAETALQREHDRAEGLLKNILPDAIALRLKDGEHLIADDHPEVSVIFADIVNFTEASAKLRPAELVETLNMVFTEFDQLAAKHGAEKIKTIGDAYMAVVGVPDATKDHATTAVDLALDMLDAARRISAKTHFPINLRIGVNSGPVVAGVIGESKFAYDLWGDAVNVAAHMESHGQPGSVLITEDTRAALGEAFTVTADGLREVKGKGAMPVFVVQAPA